jgi:hypothetical protein
MLFFYSLSHMRKQSRLAARQQFLRRKTHTHTRRLSDTQAAAKTDDDGIEAEDEDMPAVVAGQRENASLRSERNKSTWSGERREEARREEGRRVPRRRKATREPPLVTTTTAAPPPLPALSLPREASWTPEGPDCPPSRTTRAARAGPGLAWTLIFFG